MPAFRMFLVAAAGTLMALFAGPLVSSPAPAGASTITSPPTVAATNWTNGNAAAGSGSNAAERRVLHDLHLLRGGGLGERRYGRRDPHRAVERHDVDGRAERERAGDHR